MKTLIERMDRLLAKLPLTEAAQGPSTRDVGLLRLLLAESMLDSPELAETALPSFNHPEYENHVAAIRAATSPKELAMHHQRAGLLASEHGQHARAEHHFTASSEAMKLHNKHAAAKAKPAEPEHKGLPAFKTSPETQTPGFNSRLIP
jgi:hypothetical protein